ncbi:clavesin-1-like [Pectinophora gossypiella]|uniref:clavesin-1-like n=1 Tax=Pectinophora gossypiella TaxID=13191 RepID=UPI00214F3FAD|nr:clavesin-1-like [Pectinophora gossypiella]XP_049878966.1 clavesin-1-like [Pectinophora gossypiella]XP_049878967.1 clavesin-1-like [Pectinophora gossypiella]
MSSSITVKQIPLEEEYKKPNGITPEDISKLRSWLQTQPHLPADHITDLDLILAYNCCDRSAEVSKQLIDLHFTLKTLFTSYFQNRVVDDKVDRALNSLLVTPLPTRTKEGYAVLYANFLEKDAKNFHLGDVIKTVVMILDVWQYEEGSWPGFIILYDLKSLTLGHMAKFDLSNVSQYLYYLQNGLPANLRGVHYLNAPAYMDRFMTIIRPFLKASLMQLIHIHQAGATTLDSFFPIEKLPKESGGQFKGCQELKDEMIAKLHAAQPFFDEETKKRVTESLRPGKPKTITDIFGGVEGSFKKLEVD